MRALRCTLVLIVGLAGASGGSAQDRDASSQDEARGALDRARDHMERGQALYLQARFEEAAVEFEAAYDAQPFSAFLYNGAVALERAGQPERAADLFERYLASDQSASDASDVLARITELRASAAAASRTPPTPEPTPRTGAATVSPEPTTGSATPAETATAAEATPPAPEPPTSATAAPSAPPDGVPDDFKSLLSVRTNPTGATVAVRAAGRPAGAGPVAERPAPFAQTLDAGRYVLSVAHPDYQTVEQEVRVEPGQVYVIIVEMSQGEFLGYLRVVSDVAGAQVFIDDRERGARGTTPFEAPIPIGAHRVWVERPGYRLEELEAEVGVGADVTLEVELERVEFGRLRVIGNIRDARVLVDDRDVGTIPFEGDVGAGPHRLRVESDGFKAYEAQLDIAPGQLTPVRVRLRPDVGRGGAYASTVLAALFLGGGITVAVLGSERMTNLQSERDAGRLASDDPRLDEGLIMYIAADAAFGMSLIVGCLALYYFFYDPLPPSEGTVSEARDWALLPLLDPVSQTGGLGVGGSF